MFATKPRPAEVKGHGARRYSHAYPERFRLTPPGQCRNRLLPCAATPMRNVLTERYRTYMTGFDPKSPNVARVYDYGLA
jgi:hypothetical protein